MDTVTWLDAQVPDKTGGRTLDDVLARALAPDESDLRAAREQAEHAARLEDAAETRALAYRGIDLAARSQRMARAAALRDELAEAQATVARCQRLLGEIRKTDEWEAAQLERAAGLAQRSAPVGLGDVITPHTRDSHARLVERSRFMLEHGYGATLRLGMGSQAGEPQGEIARGAST